MKYSLISLRVDLETIRDRLSLLQECNDSVRDTFSWNETYKCIEDTYQALTALIERAEQVESTKDIE